MLSFLNIAVLIGLLGVSFPILIHLFARQKLKKIEFSSTEFLKIIYRQKMRRLKLKQLLLLILRCLAVFLIVFAFARPTFRIYRTGGRNLSGSSMVLVIDRSMSMGRGKMFYETRQKSDAVLDLLRGEDEAALIWSTAQHQEKLSFSHHNTFLKKEVKNKSTSFERGDLSACIEEAADLLSLSHNANREIFLISDLQASGFNSPGGSTMARSWNGPLFVIPVQGNPANSAVVDCGFENQIFQPGTPIRLFAEVKHYGEKGLEDLLVRVFLEGKAVAQKSVKLAPGETRRVLFNVMPTAGGWGWGLVRIEDDELLADNQRFFAYQIPEKIRTLIVGKSHSDYQSLKLALNPQKDNLELIHMSFAVSGEDWVEKLSNMDVVIFANYPSLTSGEAEQLKQFVTNGGGIFIFLGDDVDLREWNSLFCTPLMGLSLGNVKGGMGRSEGYLSLESIDFSHPLFNGVFEKGKENVHSPLIYRIADILGDKGYTILSLGDGSPLLKETSYGKGKIFLFASGLDESWSELTVSTLFAPLMNRSASYLSTPFKEVVQGKNVGEPISLMSSIEEVHGLYHVVDPLEEEIKVIPEVRTGKVLLRLQYTKSPGIYRFFHGSHLLGMRAVNIDMREADPHPISEEELKGLFPDAKIYFIKDTRHLQEPVFRTRWGREIWRELILIALIVLVLEMIIARPGKKEMQF